MKVLCLKIESDVIYILRATAAWFITLFSLPSQSPASLCFSHKVIPSRLYRQIVFRPTRVVRYEANHVAPNRWLLEFQVPVH